MWPPGRVGRPTVVLGAACLRVGVTHSSAGRCSAGLDTAHIGMPALSTVLAGITTKRSRAVEQPEEEAEEEAEEDEEAGAEVRVGSTA
jgi:hypothetical protein